MIEVTKKIHFKTKQLNIFIRKSFESTYLLRILKLNNNAYKDIFKIMDIKIIKFNNKLNNAPHINIIFIHNNSYCLYYYVRKINKIIKKKTILIPMNDFALT
jgi:hypothetical protein